jgi:phage shock protein PspC (stress-responsive transcriptional regulator)/predicted membrane protein
MTENSSSQASGSPTPGAPRHDLRNLRRSNDDRVIAGVCGGLGRHTGIDPIVFRIVLVALAVFGGIGLVIYALAWLLVPEDNATTSEAHRLFQGGFAPTLAAVVIGVVGIVVLIDFADHWANGRWPLLIIAAVVVVVLLSRRAGTSHAPNPVNGPTGGFYGPSPNPAQPGPAQPTAAPFAAAPPIGYTAPHYTVPLGPPAGFAPSRPIYVSAPPKPPKPPRPPSILGPLALSVGVVVIGALFALDAAHTINISAQAVLAAALLTVGIALVIGAWIGRARALIAVGVVLTVALAVTAALDVPLRGGIGTHNDAPAAVSDLPAAYHLGIGNQTIDLTQLKTGGKTVHIVASVGLGELRVFVPGDAVVKAHGRVGAGDLRLLGADTNGTHLNRTVVGSPDGPTVAGAGELDLDLRVGVGDVQVIQLLNPVPAAPLAPVAPTVPTLPTPSAPEVPQ